MLVGESTKHVLDMDQLEWLREHPRLEHVINLLFNIRWNPSVRKRI